MSKKIVFIVIMFVIGNVSFPESPTDFPIDFKNFKIPVEVGFAPNMKFPDMKFDFIPTFKPNVDLSAIDTEKTAEDFRGVINAFINPHNALRYSGIIGFGIVIGLTAQYATTIAWEVVKQIVLTPRPEIMLPDSKYGRWARIKRWWNDYTIPEMIFPDMTQKQLTNVIETTKYTRIHNKKNKKSRITYDNIILQGNPGTGKTLFAKVLADKTDMDFVCVTAASLLQSGAASVKHFNKLIRMARRSKYGLVIFVDEADALFVDRDSLLVDSDHYKVLSHILALIGEGSDKFVLIAATNHIKIMDSAMSRRFQIRIDMPLPDAKTREQVINLYVKNELFDNKKNSKEFVRQAELLFTENMIKSFVERTDGLSQAEIKDIIQTIRKKGLASFDGLLTREHIVESIENGVKKHVAFEKDKKVIA